MFSKIKDAYYNVKNGIENLINWFPVIWNDRDFDHYYFHAIMLHKLKNMEKMFRSEYAWGADSIKNADDIKHAINLLERITNDVYTEEALQPLYDKYPGYEFKFEFEPYEDNPNIHKLVDNDTEDQKKLRSECFKKSDESKEKDLNSLYKFLREHIEEWWD